MDKNAFALDPDQFSKIVAAINEDKISALLGYPLIAFLIGTAVVALTKIWYAGRVENRCQFVLVSALEDEVNLMLAYSGDEGKKFKQAYKNGQPTGLFAQRIADDPSYFPYTAPPGKPAPLVFQSPDNDFFFLDRKCFISAVEFYDTSSQLVAMLTDCRSEQFRSLNPQRKLDTIGNIVETFETYQKQGQAALDEIISRRKEISHTLPRRIWLWIVLFPNFKIFRYGIKE